MRRASLAALTLAGAAGIPAAAQVVPEETVSATISQSIEADTNYNLDDPSPGTTYFGDTRLGVEYARQTSTQSFLLGFDTGLRALWEAEEPFEFVLASPTGAVVGYEQEGLNTAFDAGFRYRQRQVDFRIPLDEFVPDEVVPGEVIDPDLGELPDDLSDTEDDARELRFDADVGFTLGTTSPSSWTFDLSGTVWDYTEDAPDLIPRSTVEAGALWTLRVTPVLSTALFGNYFYYTADNATDTEIQILEADAGVVYEPDETLLVRAGIGYADRTREDIIGGEREETENNAGPVIRGDFRYVLPDFTILGAGRLTSAAPETRFNGNLRFNYALPRGRINGRVFQRYTGSQSSGEEVRVTGAALGLRRDVTTVSQVEVDFGVARQTPVEEPDEPDIDRLEVTARYIYDLTQAVSAEMGYGYRHRIEDPEDANSHRVFFAIGRTFETGL